MMGTGSRAMGLVRKAIQTMVFTGQKTDLTLISRTSIDYPDTSVNPPGAYQVDRTAPAQALHSKFGLLDPQHHWMLCQLHSCKPERGQCPPQGSRERGTRPGEHWELDLTEVTPTRFGYKYLLVLWTLIQGEWKCSLCGLRLPILPQRS